MEAIHALAGSAKLTFRDGRYISDAVEKARQAEVAIIFATQWETEGLDLPDLSLPDGQDELIAAVAAANPNTIVVLETGGPVKMAWLDKVAGRDRGLVSRRTGRPRHRIGALRRHQSLGSPADHLSGK